MLREALLVHLKSSRVEPCQTSRLDTERHPGLHGQLEARTEDTMSPQVRGHVEGPKLFQPALVGDAAGILREQLEK